MSDSKKSAARGLVFEPGHVGLVEPGGLRATLAADAGRSAGEGLPPRGLGGGAGALAVLAAASIAGLASAGAAPVAQAQAVDMPVQQAGVPVGVDATAVQTHVSALSQVRLSQVQGAFGFTQGEVTPTAQIARDLGGVNKVLCGASAGVVAGSESAVADAADWQVTLDGDGVHSTLSATIGELAQDGVQSTVMGCSCAGNPADGRATVNAAVTGVSVYSMIEAAGGLVEGANAITFVSADGYEVELPLTYVLQRASMLVYQINGEPLSASVGGTNQLWLGSTAARYFASDVVEIRVTCEEQAPAIPGTPASGDHAANLPNVGLSAGAAQA